MTPEERLMDFKADTLVNVSSFLSELDANNEQEASLNAMKRVPPKRFKKPSSQQSYCRLCWAAKLRKEIYKSHNLGDDACSQLSYQDKKSSKNHTNSIC